VGEVVERYDDMVREMETVVDGRVEDVREGIEGIGKVVEDTKGGDKHEDENDQANVERISGMGKDVAGDDSQDRGKGTSKSKSKEASARNLPENHKNAAEKDKKANVSNTGSSQTYAQEHKGLNHHIGGYTATEDTHRRIRSIPT
jgi:hypothetical protein